MSAGWKLLSCDAVILRETTAGLRVRMLRVFRHWDFPKGLMEAGETPKQAALREVREEPGLAELTFPWGDIHIDTGPYSRSTVSTAGSVSSRRVAWLHPGSRGCSTGLRLQL